MVFNTAILQLFNTEKIQRGFKYLRGSCLRARRSGKIVGAIAYGCCQYLPGVLKRRYLDYLKKSGLYFNRPGFESLRKFIVEELSIMTSDYAQTFLKSDDKEKSHESGVGRGFVRVRQVATKAPVVQTSQTNNKEPDLRNNSGGNQRLQLTKPPRFALSAMTPCRNIF